MVNSLFTIENNDAIWTSAISTPSSPSPAPANFAARRCEQRVSALEPEPAAARHGGASRRPADEPHHPQRRADGSRRAAACRRRTGDRAISAMHWNRCAACARCRREGSRINAPPPAIDLVLAPMIAAVSESLSEDRPGDRRREFVRRHRRRPASTPGCAMASISAQDMIAVSLGAAAYAVVASPQYVAQHSAGRNSRRICLITPASGTRFAQRR